MSELVYSDHNGLVVMEFEVPGPKGDFVRGHKYYIGRPQETALCELNFQNGPVPEVGVNGATNETVIAAVIHRLEILNAKFPCAENEQAITSLKDALQALESRTRNRQQRGVEGKLVA
jgi:hypothetical protein